MPKKLMLFIYLNTYAFSLLFTGVIVSFTISMYKIVLPPWLLQVFIALICFVCSVSLFSQYRRRLRVLALLLHRNRKEFRPDTFRLVMQKLCGRLLARVALKELGQIDKFRELKKLYGCPFRDPNNSPLDLKQQGDWENEKSLS